MQQMWLPRGVSANVFLMGDTRIAFTIRVLIVYLEIFYQIKEKFVQTNDEFLSHFSTAEVLSYFCYLVRYFAHSNTVTPLRHCKPSKY